MFKEIIKEIGTRSLYIYGAGARARLLASYLEAKHGVQVAAFAVTDRYNVDPEYTLQTGRTVRTVTFDELRAQVSDASKIFFINAVANAAKHGLVETIDEFMLSHGGNRCISFTDGAHEEHNAECLRFYMTELGADLNAEILCFNGARVYNPSYAGITFEPMYPAIGDLILPIIYGDRSLEVNGEYENDGVRLAPGELVLDIGANLGVFACCAAHKGCKVIAFEPNRELSPLLNEQRDLYDGSISIEPLALSNFKGTTSMSITVNTASSSLSGWSGSSHTVDVDVTTLDDYVKSHDISGIGFIKCDVVGAEKEFIQGALETIKQNEPKIAIHIYEHLNPDIFNYITDAIRSVAPRYRFSQKREELFAWVE